MSNIETGSKFLVEAAEKAAGAIRRNASVVADNAAQLKTDIAERAQEIKKKIGEEIDGVKTKMKAYIGSIEEAPEHIIDNIYIRNGYRINHNTCRSLWKSLFTCHNEFVNVWSHIIGVLVFLTLLVIVCVQVIPNQFWYAHQLGKDYASLPPEVQDPIVFTIEKLAELDVQSKAAAELPLSTYQGQKEFDGAITDVMYRVEGISHFTIDHFTSFDYLAPYEEQYDPTLESLLDAWFSSLTDYNIDLLGYVEEGLDLLEDSKLFQLDPYVKKRVSSCTRNISSQAHPASLLTVCLPE